MKQTHRIETNRYERSGQFELGMGHFQEAANVTVDERLTMVKFITCAKGVLDGKREHLRIFRQDEETLAYLMTEVISYYDQKTSH
jgi:hypothetical protein